MAHRNRRGFLERVLDISPEIRLEVVSYLSPLDLLRLVRLSEDLHSLLTGPTSNVLWKAARQTVDCPAPVTGLSELALADLVYVKKCHFCRVADVRKVMFSFLTRICKACYKEHVISHRATDSLTALMASLVPTVTKGKTIKYLRKDFKAVKAEYLSLPINERAAYYTERQAYLKELGNFYRIGTIWYAKRPDVRSEELAEKKEERVPAIIKKLEDLGYGDAFQSDNFRSQFYKHPAVNKPKELNGSSWTAVRDTIIEMAEGAMKELADKREAGALAAENHISIATALLEGPDPSRITKVPTIVDFLDVPHHKNLIDAPVSMTLTERELKPLVDAFRDEWMDRTLDTLIQVLGELQPKRLTKSQKRAYLKLARNVFECRGCSSRGLVFPQVLEHKCCIYSLPELERRCVWTARYLSRQETAFMTTFIRAIGLNTETATVDDIASLDQRYLCLLCPEASHLDGKPRIVYEWRPFVEHMDGHISGRTNVVSYPQDSEILPLERLEDDPAANDTQTDVARRGCRIPGCRDPNCLLIRMQG
ncbi:hypothetical protein EDD18DRAFT_1466118 [Armillaria luteobubalina]|uniref:F-box domain-containing protein n=1 Tax=Armillaria luteobubalina TaxID=153913 RepID=A0AA39THX6_9AGAR|nr:hypothetical protein EDD18DRAFT_1466118 [Armillaria luteobubalina]